MARLPLPMTPTGLIRSSDATAKAPAKATAKAYLLIAVEDSVMEADVSTTRYTGTCLVDRYSLIKTFPIRALTRQSMDFTGSPYS